MYNKCTIFAAIMYYPILFLNKCWWQNIRDIVRMILNQVLGIKVSNTNYLISTHGTSIITSLVAHILNHVFIIDSMYSTRTVQQYTVFF